MLKVLMKKRNLDAKKKMLEELRTKDSNFEKREKELESDIEEAATGTEEEMKAVEETVDQFESEKQDHEKEKSDLEKEIEEIEKEIKEIEDSAPKDVTGRSAKKEEEREVKTMNNRKFFGMNMQERDAFFGDGNVKEFLQRIRTLYAEKRSVTGAELMIPEVVLDLVREQITKYSKLMAYVNKKSTPGKARQNIMGSVPEAIWMEAMGILNELDFDFSQIEVDGYMIGGFIAVHDTILSDVDDINLASELISGMGQSVGIGIDKSIPYGTGVKMPFGFVTRLAQTSEPDNYDKNSPAWNDLHVTNLIKFDSSNMKGEEFFATLLKATNNIKTDYAVGPLVWLMNRTTHTEITSKALNFTANGALVSAEKGTMPIVGGDIVELDFIPKGDILVGYLKLYLLAERQGTTIGQSEHVRFLRNQKVFKVVARYDGKPVIASAFMGININNQSVTTVIPFAYDYANNKIQDLTVKSEASSSTNGYTVITVDEDKAEGNEYYYRIDQIPSLIYNGQSVANSKEWKKWDGTSEIKAKNDYAITVVEADKKLRAVKVGYQTVKAKTE
ncbi:phage major capsid protein [Holdemania massiliensis]|uniref:phage major capsid protein n=1 Tax=Holdemania massiliensis TaxID=1468449 RepID=UPI00242B9D02|nr:phage major capsid protein [Holdemania massiliensis]